MKLHFTSKHIPGLEKLSIQDRLGIIAKANKRLSGPEKLFLNILKLLIITPIFVLLTGQFGWIITIAGILICVLLFPAMLRPIQLALCAKYIPELLRKL